MKLLLRRTASTMMSVSVISLMISVPTVAFGDICPTGWEYVKINGVCTNLGIGNYENTCASEAVSYGGFDEGKVVTAPFGPCASGNSYFCCGRDFADRLVFRATTPACEGGMGNTCTSIFLISQSGSIIKQIDNVDGLRPKLSSDCKKIAFTETSTSGVTISVYDLDNDSAMSLVAGQSPTWSPDGQKIAYMKHVGNGKHHIAVVNIDGSGEIDLTPQFTSTTPPVWSPDGSKIAFVGYGPGYDVALRTMNTSGGGLQIVREGPTHGYNWSPDSQRFVFHTNTDTGGFGIHIMNNDGSDVTKLTDGPGDSEPTWSWDGNRIAFVKGGGSNNQLYIMNENGTNQVQLSDFPGVREPDWSGCSPKEEEGNASIFKGIYHSEQHKFIHPSLPPQRVKAGVSPILKKAMPAERTVAKPSLLQRIKAFFSPRKMTQ